MPTRSYSLLAWGYDFIIIKWTGLVGGDDGEPYHLGAYTDVSIHVKGTFNGQTLTIEGDNDTEGSATWSTLRDAQGNNLTFASAALKQLLECVAKIRPIVSAGAGVSLEVYMKAVK